MTDTTAKIRAKGLDATGVTEEIADEMYAHKGKHYMAIVELNVDETHDRADGKRKVDLVFTQVEPALDDRLDEHLRELTRTLHYNRKLHSPDEQLQIDTLDDVEPTVEGVVAAGQHFIAAHDDELPDPEDEPDDDQLEPEEPAAAEVIDPTNPFAVTTGGA